MARTAPVPIFTQVQKHAERTGCKCPLKAGMTWEDLRALGAGCTRSKGPLEPGFVCPTLGFYREKVDYPDYHKGEDA